MGETRTDEKRSWLHQSIRPPNTIILPEVVQLRFTHTEVKFKFVGWRKGRWKRLHDYVLLFSFPSQHREKRYGNNTWVINCLIQTAHWQFKVVQLNSNGDTGSYVSVFSCICHYDSMCWLLQMMCVHPNKDFFRTIPSTSEDKLTFHCFDSWQNDEHKLPTANII
jgi:hypothetical protein